MPSGTPLQRRLPLGLANPHMCAYLAGFIDGEGTLTVTRNSRKDRPGYFRLNIRLAVYNTNIELLAVLRDGFGGTIMIANMKDQRWKPQGQLVWSEEQIVPILTAVRPFLILKAEQADILLALQGTKLQASQGRKRGHTAEVVSLRDEAYKRLKILNKRGTNAQQNSSAS